jgi:UDP-N-acetylmuramyl pentapeptide phosphotransferase/UDP-N-acetylglucosamine-1-phosphate transferase
VDYFNFFTFFECALGGRCSFSIPFFVSFILSISFCYLIISTTKLHGRLSLDLAEGIQKVHHKATPRIGGLGIYLSLLLATLLSPYVQLTASIVASALPAFFAGLTEDLTKKVPPKQRLAATTASGLLAFYLTGYHLTGIGITLIDVLFSIVWISVIFSAFAVAGIANSYNIIDGFNGLAGIVALIAFIAIALVSTSVGDLELASVSWIFVGAILGFTALNWPYGRIFLGDGGSYLVGFAVGWLSIMLVERNSTVSPFACLLICIYPITEVVFSIYRRSRGSKDTTSPDRLHLHSLFARRFINRKFHKLSPIKKNSLTGLSMSLLALPSGLLVLLVYESTLVCIIFCLLFIITYVLAYRRLVIFR